MQTVSPKTIFLIETLPNTQETYSFDTSCYYFYLPAISWQLKNTTNVYVFRLRQHFNEPLRKHRLSSAGSKGHVCRVLIG